MKRNAVGTSADVGGRRWNDDGSGDVGDVGDVGDATVSIMMILVAKQPI